MDLVTYQITKKLKEKGFPVKGKEIIYGDNGAFIPTPTIYQVLKWLREDKKLHIHPEPAYFSKVGLWEVYIVNINDYV